MKVLEVFENKLRYKNYSDNTIKTYKQTLSQFLKEVNCKDTYQISTKQIIEYLVIFENDISNVDIVFRRQNMWFYINELKNDKFMKKFVLW